MPYEVVLLDPAKDFLVRLGEKLQAKAYRAIDLLAHFGPLLRMPHSRKLGDYELWELRVQQAGMICRLFYFHRENQSRRDTESTATEGGVPWRNHMNSTRYADFLKQQLRNPKVRKEYDALEGEFALAKEIIELRIRKKLTQKQLAQQIGTSQPAIARIESGSYQNVSLSFLRRVADALGAVPEIHLKRKGA